ncbi:MAG: hypothetical protein RL375_2787, partial [Pseudomonadota bacterium]
MTARHAGGRLALAAALVLAAGVGSPVVQAQVAAAASADIAAGERLYRDGLRPDGRPVQARRPPVDAVVSGAAAACVACHRRSGMGMQEGRSLVPPVAGALLFKPGAPYRPVRAAAPGSARRAASAAAQSREPARHLARPAYDVASLTRALRDGVDPAGRPLDALMPRYALEPAEVAQLAAYLHQLDPGPASGLDELGVLHLATVITPDAPAHRRAVVVDTLQRWADAVALRGRRLRLHVWQLAGDSATWPGQLERYQQDRPVYAVVSGAGRDEWAPVQGFCEARRLPCLLPLIDRLPAVPGEPTGAVDDPYFSLYFSGGVEAEAQLAARHLLSAPLDGAAPASSAPGAASVLQVHVPGDPLGAAAARRFADTWAEAPGLATLELDARAPDAAERLLAAGASARRVLLWVEPAQLQ